MATPSLLTTLLILLISLGATRLLGQKLARWAIPALVIELLIGFGLGNTVLPFAAIAPLSGITELGVLTLFFQVGLEVRSDLLSARPWTITRLVALSFLTPLLAYWPLVSWFAMTPATALLCLACLSATGTGVTLRLLNQRQALRTPSGRLLVGVSVLDDLPAITLLALAVAAGGKAISGNGLGMAGLGVGLVFALVSASAVSLWVRRRGQHPIGAVGILLLLIGPAWVGEVSGLTSLLGALWGGVLLGRLSPPEESLNRVLGVLSEVFLPLYFISVGMRVSAGSLVDGRAWSLAVVLLVAAMASKLACGLGISARDRRDGVDRALVVFGLIPRGLPGLVFATTALAAGLINQPQFSALVLMVTVTTVAGLLLLGRRLLQLGPDRGRAHD
ncbi:MAG: cation:proton antiporter [Cyanobacteriota bacterium]|nr:cation:proton antiporter [Cyanobacteriota bacterium]